MMKKIGILVAALVIGGPLSAMIEQKNEVAIAPSVELEKLLEKAVAEGLVTQEEAQVLALDKNTDSRVSCSENRRKYIIAALVVLAAAGVVGAGYYLHTILKVTESKATEPVAPVKKKRNKRNPKQVPPSDRELRSATKSSN